MSKVKITMEVIRFTKGLEQKIRADGDAKAKKIIADGEKECQRIMKDFEARFASFESERRAETESKIAALQRDAQSELILKQERLQLSFKASWVLSQINEYLGALSTDRVLLLLEGLFTKYKEILSGRQLVAKVVALDVALVEPLLVKVFGRDSLLSCKTSEPFPLSDAFVGYEDAETSNLHAGVILETSDGSIRCNGTMGELITPLLENNMEEMITSLFGEGFSV